MDRPASLPNKLWYLKHIRLFDGISPAEMQEMEKMTPMEEVKKRQPLYLPGDVFGELEALDGVPRATTTEAIDDALICAIPRDAFTTII